MAEKDPNKLYNGIKTLQDDLESIRSLVDGIIENSKTLMNDANGFGGVIAKVFKEQMAKYFVPGVQKIAEPIDNLVSGDRVPGSLKDLTIFLDSVPLAMIRQEPSVTELASPVVPKNVSLDTPAGKVESAVDEIPQGQSYQNDQVTATPDEELAESKKKTSVGFRKFKEFIDWDKEEDQEKWRNSPKGKAEGQWFKNRVYGLKKGYNPFEDDANVNKPWNGQGNEHDAKESLDKFGRVYINGDNFGVLSPSYASSLLKTWGEPNKLDVESDYFPPVKDSEWDNIFAKSYVKKYYKGDIDLETLYDLLAEIFGSREEAEVWFDECGEEIKSNMFEAEDDGPGIWQILRKSGIGSSLGEDVANVEPQVVCEFKTKEEAEERLKVLEDSVLPEEKELLGVSYELSKLPLVSIED